MREKERGRNSFLFFPACDMGREEGGRTAAQKKKARAVQRERMRPMRRDNGGAVGRRPARLRGGKEKSVGVRTIRQPKRPHLQKEGGGCFPFEERKSTWLLILPPGGDLRQQNES